MTRIRVTTPAKGSSTIRDSKTLITGQLRIINSDESFDETISTGASPYELPDTSVTLKDSAGTAIGTAQALPSAVPGDALVPDVTYTDSDGDTVTQPAAVPIVCTFAEDVTIAINGENEDTAAPGALFSLIALLDNVAGGVYNAMTKTLSFVSNIIVVGSSASESGCTTSYQTGDTAYQEALEDGSFFALDYTNPYGNTTRFMDELGGTTYTKGIVIDWSQYRLGKVRGYSRVHPATGNTAAQITNCRNFSVAPYTSGWHICSRSHYEKLVNGSLANPLGYAPFLGHIDLSASVVTGQRYPSAPSAYCWALNSIGYMSPKDLTEGTRSIATRLFTVTINGSTVTLT